MGAAAIPIALALAAGTTAYTIKEGQDAKSEAKRQQEEAQRRQDAQAAAQLQAIKEAPQKIAPTTAAQSARRRYQAGFAATVATSPLGVTGPASTAQAGLIGGQPKQKLGQ